MGHHKACAVLVSGLMVTGCGTVSNLAPTAPPDWQKTPFGGVKHDMTSIREAADDGPDQAKRVAVVAACAADLPLSLVGDTLTYPYIQAFNFINSPTLAGPALLMAPPDSGLGPPPKQASQLPLSPESDKAGKPAGPKAAAPETAPASPPSVTLPPRGGSSLSPGGLPGTFDR